MKKILIAVIVATMLFGASNLFAQTSGLIGKGIKVGLNLTNVTGSDVPDNVKMKIGLAAGGYITYAFNDLFAIQPEVLYAMKGYKYDYTSLITPYAKTTNSVKLSYIEIPVLGKVLLRGNEKFKPNFYAGPAFGFLMSAKNQDTDIKSDLKSMDIGLIGGAGAEIPMGSGKLTFDVRYEVGLTKIDNTAAKAKINNSAITFLLGYGF
jgi:hypothetical protein